MCADLARQDTVEEIGPVSFETAQGGGGGTAGRALRNVYIAIAVVHIFGPSSRRAFCPIDIESLADA
jgi:hypothetical protein